jgi:hypothetical protein
MHGALGSTSSHAWCSMKHAHGAPCAGLHAWGSTSNTNACTFATSMCTRPAARGCGIPHLHGSLHCLEPCMHARMALSVTHMLCPRIPHAMPPHSHAVPPHAGICTHVSSSVMASALSSLNLYWKPEQPPPSTSIRNAMLVSGVSACSCFKRCACGGPRVGCQDAQQGVQSMLLEKGAYRGGAGIDGERSCLLLRSCC